MADTQHPEALRLAAWLNEGAWHQMTLGDAEAAGRELRRLHAENATLQAGYDAALKEIEALRARVQEVGAAAKAEHAKAQAAAHAIAAKDAERYRWIAAHCRSTSEHWGGRWSIVVDGPAPKSHDSEDDFDAAIDAARKQGANHD